MGLTRRTMLPSAAARARDMPTLKIGRLSDMRGPYKDLAGPGAVAAVNQAQEEYGLSGKGMKVEVLSADHLNKPDIGSTVARQWFDRDGVDLIVDVANSGVALAVAGVAKEKDKVCVNPSAATSDLNGSACNANTIHWVYDTYMLAKSTGGAMVKAGGESWLFITANYAFGKASRRGTTNFVSGAGGKVLGSVAYPFPGRSDFASYLIDAQASGAKVRGLANAGTDTINVTRQAKEFGVTAKMRLAGLLLFLTDIDSLGLEIARGIMLTDSFYRDMNERARAFSNRLSPKIGGARPTMAQAGVYSSALHDLKTASVMGRIKLDGAATIRRMKKIPANDDCVGPGTIRADGREPHPAYPWEVKKPSESKGAWDYYKPLAITPADQAFRPLDPGACPLVET